MLKRIHRSLTSYRRLRELNREMKFEEVKSLFEASQPLTDTMKCNQQYLHALRYLPQQTPSEPPPQDPQRGNNEDEPIYVKTVSSPKPFLIRNWSIFKKLLNLAVPATLLFLFYTQSKGPMGSMTEQKKHVAMVEKSSNTFDDVKGINECKAELEEIVDFLKNPGKYHSVGAKMPKGLLLTGRPGTGKTLLARAIAGEAGVHFFYNSGSDFEEVFVGLGAKRVRELFQEAKKYAPCIVFIDEIDAVGASRKSQDFNYNRQTLNQLLVEMDGFKPTDNVLVVAATNLPETLDNALKRPGRFDKIIDIPVPDINGRQEIINYYLKKVHTDQSLDSFIIARGTTGMTGADISNLINLAALNSVKEGRSAINMQDIEYARDRVLMGVERRTLTMTENEKYLIAVHETGHALTALLTPGASPIHKTTILPRGSSLGVTILLPEKDNLNYTREQVLAQIDVCMGGRAAEELFVGTDELTTGCSDDLNKATKMAYQFVRSGMFEEITGLINVHSLDSEGKTQRDEIDSAVKQILDESYARVLDTLRRNVRVIKRIASDLKDKESLTREEFLGLAKGAA